MAHLGVLGSAASSHLHIFVLLEQHYSRACQQLLGRLLSYLEHTDIWIQRLLVDSAQSQT